MKWTMLYSPYWRKKQIYNFYIIDKLNLFEGRYMGANRRINMTNFELKCRFCDINDT